MNIDLDKVKSLLSTNNSNVTYKIRNIDDRLINQCKDVSSLYKHTKETEKYKTLSKTV